MTPSTAPAMPPAPATPAADEPSARQPRRTVAIPAVLLVAGTVAVLGLAAPAPSTDTLRITAAATTSSIVELPGATSSKRLDLLDGRPAVTAATPTTTATTPRASRARTRTAPAQAPAKRVVKKAVERDRFVRPNGGGISSPYGPRWGRMHKGLDFNGSYGSAIYAVTAGRVISAGYDGGYGNLVTVRHADGTVTAYAHMSRILVRGGAVEAGETIGLVGSTGNSTGPHLHFEVRIGGGNVNPAGWLRKHGVRV